MRRHVGYSAFGDPPRTPEDLRRQRKHEWLDMSAVERANWLLEKLDLAISCDGYETEERIRHWHKLLAELITDAGADSLGVNGNPAETAARKLYVEIGA